MIKIILWIFPLFYIFPFAFVPYRDYPFEIFQILVLIASFYMGVVVVLSRVSRPNPRNIGLVLVPKVVLQVLAGLYVVVKLPDIVQAGMALRAGTLTALMLERAVERYATGGEVTSLIGVLSLGIVLVFAGVLGNRVHHARSEKRYYVVFFGMLVMESLALSRAGVLLALLAYGTEVLIIFNRALLGIRTMRLFRDLTLGAVALFGIYMFSQFFRVYPHPDALEIALNNFYYYTLANYELLLIWMSQQDRYPLEVGLNTFASAYKMFGYEAQQGFYDMVNLRGTYTNIFTPMRGLLADFGFFGTAVACCGAGGLVAVASLRGLTLWSYLPTKVVLSILFYPFYSPFIFTVFALGVLSVWVLYVVLHLVRLEQRSLA